jgi:hypothetical protein
MSFRCKCDDGLIRNITWQYIKKGWVAVSTVCTSSLYKLKNYTPITVNLIAKIYVFINERYVDHTTDSGINTDSESNNLISTLESQGFDINTFTDIGQESIESILSAVGRNGIIAIPELENESGGEGGENDGNGILNNDLSSISKQAIKKWVSDGGSLVAFFPSNDSLLETINSIFDFEMELSDNINEPIQLTGEETSIFESAPSEIPDNNATRSIVTTSLPERSVTIYAGDGENQSVVVLINYGIGSILIMGWDWYDAAPHGSQDGGWLEVLRLFVASKIEPGEIPACYLDGTIITEFPLEEPMSGSTLTGCLYGSAVYLNEDEEAKVRLTQNNDSLNGQIGYRGTLPTAFSTQFEFKHISFDETPGDSIYFYFNADSIPDTEDADIEGYIIGFSEYHTDITVRYGSNYVNNIIMGSRHDFDFSSDVWYTAKIVFLEGVFSIYIDDELIFETEDQDLEERTIDGTHNKFGLGSRTGSAVAEHYVRNLIIQEEIS